MSPQPMTNEQFAALVRAMRAAQKEYFRTRNRAILDRSIALEASVDMELSWRISTPGLFDHEETA